MLPMPPEPEWRDGSWWYLGGKYLKTEAFREYHDDRSIALAARIAELAEYSPQHKPGCVHYIVEANPNLERDLAQKFNAELSEKCSCCLSSLLEQLRREGLIP